MRTVSETSRTLYKPAFELQGVSEDEKGSENTFEKIIIKQFPNMGKEIFTHIQEVQRVPSMINPRRKTWRHILMKLIKKNNKCKEKSSKAAREKQKLTSKGLIIRLSNDLSAETLQARREWQDISKVIIGGNLQPRLPYPARISFRFNGEIKPFIDKQKLRVQHHQIRFTT